VAAGADATLAELRAWVSTAQEIGGAAPE
jgi:hypothetical protein